MLLPACQPFSGSVSLLPPQLHSLHSVARPSARCKLRPATARHAASALVSGTKGEEAFPGGEARCQATLALPPSSPPQTSLLNLLPSACVAHKSCSTLTLPTLTLSSSAPCADRCTQHMHTATAIRSHYHDIPVCGIVQVISTQSVIYGRACASCFGSRVALPKAVWHPRDCRAALST